MGDHQPGHDISAKERTMDVLTKENVSFKDLLLSSNVLSGLQKSRFDRPSPIQLKAIPYGRCGLDLIVQAKSGTGKTCVFTVIALEAISTDAPTLQVIILAPTREIAIQIEDVIAAVGRDIKGLKVGSFIGGRPVYEDKVNAKGCHIAVGSPGRIFQLIELEILKCQNVRIFILDEADKLLEENFQSQINSIYSMLPTNKQMIAASATYPNELAEFVTRYMREPTFIRLNPKDMALLGINQYYFLVEDPPDKFHSVFECKIKAVVTLLEHYPFQQALIFSNYHSHAKDLSDACNSVGLPATYISGNLEQERRLEAMKMLKDFKCKVLVSTDLTSRGIDASNVDLVLNLDVPLDWETYMHRTGRAGRFGSHGAVVSVVTSGDECDKLFDIARVCNIKLFSMTCNSGEIQYGSEASDLRTLSPKISIEQNDEITGKGNSLLSHHRIKAESTASSDAEEESTEATDQSSLSQSSLNSESMGQIPKIPSLPELMSKIRIKPKYSYAYHELMENWNYFKEHGVFKELRRIKEEGKTTGENNAHERGHSLDSSSSNLPQGQEQSQEQLKVVHSLFKNHQVDGDPANGEVKPSQTDRAATESKYVNQCSQLNSRQHQKPSKDLRTKDKSEQEISWRSESSRRDADHAMHKVASKYSGSSKQSETKEQLGDCSIENIHHELNRRSTSQTDKHRKEKSRMKKQHDFGARYVHEEIPSRSHRNDKHKIKSKSKHYNEHDIEKDGAEDKPRKPKIGNHRGYRDAESCIAPPFLLPRYSNEQECPDFDWREIPDFIQLQKHSQMAWQNYFNYWWAQWYGMHNFQWHGGYQK